MRIIISILMLINRALLKYQSQVYQNQSFIKAVNNSKKSQQSFGKYKMLQSLQHLKSQKERLDIKINLRQQKTLKSKVRKMLPSDFIKIKQKQQLIIDQNGQKRFKSVNQGQIAKFYNFSQLTIPQIQRILYNPMYYLITDRNLRIFKMYLYKARLIEKLENLASLNADKTNSVNYRKNILDYQFQDKSKINYRDPWQYMAQKTDMSNIYERRNTSSRQKKQKLLLTSMPTFNSVRTFQSKSEPKLKTISKMNNIQKSLNSSKSLIDRKSFTERKSQLIKQRLKKQNLGRFNYLMKLNNAANKMMQLKQSTSLTLKKRSQTLESRISFAKVKRQRIINSFCMVVQKSQQIRQKCLDTMKSRKQQWKLIQDKKTQQARIRTQKMKSYLQLKLNLNI